MFIGLLLKVLRVRQAFVGLTCGGPIIQRERERERERERDRQTDRRTDRQTDRLADRQTDKEAGRQAGRQRETETETETETCLFRRERPETTGYSLKTSRNKPSARFS